MTTYTRHPLEVQDIAAGSAAFVRGLARHHNVFNFWTDPQRHLAWDEGWKAAAHDDRAERSSWEAAAAFRARQMSAELPEATRDVLKLKGMI